VGDARAEVTALLERPDSIRPVYQPILDLRSGLVAKYEALARFDADADLRPDQWFALAHRCGLGLELELHAVRAALTGGSAPGGAKVCINLSPSALVADATHHALPDDLSDVVIEVTENELVEDGSGLERALADLRARGAELAVDDLGAGYAGFKQLMRLHPDVIKLDRVLVDGVAREPAKSALVDSMVRFARRIGAAVCAEGIESIEDLRTLADLDVTYGQGYGIARPAPAWAPACEDAVQACVAARESLLRDGGLGGGRDVNPDVRLEVVMRSIFSASAVEDLDVTLRLVARELHADEVHLSRAAAGGGLEAIAAYGAPGAAPLTTSKRRAIGSLECVQVLVSDPGADAGEIEDLFTQGLSSRLIVPVPSGGSVVGLLTAENVSERPWSRTEVHRARVIAHALGAFLVTVTSAPRRRELDPLPLTPDGVTPSGARSR
jgi:EAL domain-containing protein (putative c-di-GMP-specific phosphodiesterase class I)